MNSTAVPPERKEGYARLDDLQAIDASITMGQSAFSATTCRFGITGTAIALHSEMPRVRTRNGSLSPCTRYQHSNLKAESLCTRGYGCCLNWG